MKEMARVDSGCAIRRSNISLSALAENWILHEDNHLLVVEKPVGMSVQGDLLCGDNNLLSILKQYLKVKYHKPGNAFLGLVHRLDRPVGGVMVFAKTSKCAARLSDQIRQHRFKKTYLAVVMGRLSGRGRLEHHLYKDRKHNMVYVVDPSHNKGKKAVLDYQAMADKDDRTLVKIDLQTGRPHQIRVQFSTIGHCLFGDRKYGYQDNEQSQDIALWAHQLGFDHPTRKQFLMFKSMPPVKYPWNLFHDILLTSEQTNNGI